MVRFYDLSKKSFDILLYSLEFLLWYSSDKPKRVVVWKRHACRLSRIKYSLQIQIVQFSYVSFFVRVKLEIAKPFVLGLRPETLPMNIFLFRVSFLSKDMQIWSSREQRYYIFVLMNLRTSPPPPSRMCKGRLFIGAGHIFKSFSYFVLRFYLHTQLY